MKNQNRLKEFRTLNCLTQEALSEASGISIRTIQRIEKGLSAGSAHTIKSLAGTLNVAPELLLASEKNRHTPDADLFTVKIMNFSILSVFFVPFGNLILPAIIFRLNKTNEKVVSLGKQIIRFQIICTTVLFYLTMLIFMYVDRGSGAIPVPVLICYVMYISINILIVVRTFIHLEKEQKVPKFFPKIT